MSSWSQMAVQASRTGMAPAAAQPSDANMASGDNLDKRLLHIPQRQQEPLTSTQALLSCSRAPDQDLAQISLDLGDQLAMYIGWFLATLSFLDVCLPSPLTNLRLPFSLSGTSPPCTLSPQWCPTTQCQGSWLGHRWRFFE